MSSLLAIVDVKGGDPVRATPYTFQGPATEKERVSAKLLPAMPVTPRRSTTLILSLVSTLGYVGKVERKYF